MSTVESSPYTPFELSLVPNRDEVAVVVAGDLDLMSATDVEQAVEELTAAGFERIVLDLRGVEFIDSAGLRTLLSMRNDAKRCGHTLTLVPATPAAQRIFALTGTRGLFDWRERFDF